MYRDAKISIGDQICSMRLLLDKAPRLCRSFSALLPITSFALHAKFAGDEFYFMVPKLWEAENVVASVEPGDVAYYPDRQTVCVFYGEIVPFGAAGLFGKIVDGLDGLKAIGPRMWKGAFAQIHVEGGKKA